MNFDLAQIPRELFYGGDWQAPRNGRMLRTFDPATGDDLGPFADADEADVELALTAARSGFDRWRNYHHRDRATRLRECASRLRAHASELAYLDALNAGLPILAMMQDVAAAAAYLEYCADLAGETKGVSIPSSPTMLHYTIREPLGVVARINAFNHPLLFGVGKAVAALATGNSVVVKPPEQAPLSSLRLAQLWSDILPPGVFNVVSGGRETGALLAGHPLVDKVGLIGSVPTGRKVMEAAARTLKRVSLELGGKNPLVAMPDADADRVADAVVAGMNLNWTAGQSCGAISRAFIHASMHDQVVEKVVERIISIAHDLPTSPDCQMGCLINEAQYERFAGYVTAGEKEGAKLVFGGNRIMSGRFAKGFFVVPAIFTDVSAHMRIAREEVFGPLLCVQKWTDEDSMIRDVNDVEYGLAASIWTNDVTKAHELASRVNAGYLWLNDVSAHYLGVPFGGVKQSGIGRDECIEELLSNTQVKAVNLRLRQGP